MIGVKKRKCDSHDNVNCLKSGGRVLYYVFPLIVLPSRWCQTVTYQSETNGR